MSNTITAHELHDRLNRGEKFSLIDVRTPAEYEEAHIPGTMNIPMEQVEFRLADFAREEPAVIVCQSGKRAQLCVDILEGKRQGLILLEGGTSAWRDGGFDLIGNRASRMPLMRQVQLTAGVLIMASVALATSLSPAWLLLTIGIGVGIFIAGASGYCALASIMAIMPWNRQSNSGSQSTASKGA
jgi:rhodanese-related sulfurtransferase